MINPRLYASLKARFGKVKIANEGQKMIVREVRDIRDPRKFRLTAEDSGEYYRVDCPFCGDTRQRLWINHRWNTKDGDGKNWGWWLAVCYNENCRMDRLKDELESYLVDRPVIESAHRNALHASESFVEVALPGECVPLSALPAGHAARAYVTRRRFCPYELAEQWGVHFCVDAPDDGKGLIPETRWHARMVRGRLIVPIYRLGTMVGWQARAIDDQKPKYYTMPGLKKQHLIYNSDRARTFSFGVVVEGVTDAWRVGLRGAAIFGKEISYFQRQLITQFWSRGSMCLLLDPDALEDVDKVNRMINLKTGFKWGAFALKLPDNNDPADMEREKLWELISDHARSRNVQITL